MRCTKCKSTLGYVRLKTNTYICRNCGIESKIIDAKQMAKNFMGLGETKK